MTLKRNVDKFNQDVLAKSGYEYTTNEKYSSCVANKRLTDATLEAIDPSYSKIIDVGCGDGLYTHELKTAFPKIEFVGVDPAGVAIERAKKLYPNIQFFEGNGLDESTLPKGSFDLAVLRGVLHHTSNPALIIRNMYPLARKLIIIEPNGNNFILKLIEKLSKYHREHEERSFFPSTLAKQCVDAGYKVTSINYAGLVPFFFPTFLAKILYAVQPFLEKIPVIRQCFTAVSVIECERTSVEK